ncbi:MAG TPA: hypothetical protein VJN18_32420 [Polyangiaceae bacterium]|nr:hypothetical protein [Polyangiaceae bacterium]
MDPKTGAIAHFEKESDAVRAGFTKALTKDEAKELGPMNRKARRAWVSKSRKKNKRG